ncbi:MAG: DUF294 nucleotidyltransferase-like domain-containing protein [Burkholderiaceae bacterium]|nr:DUF294 nucleotidyltransferase-like domain-containing protein [Burkholderiaceae bacterium]MEB2320278.1 DUF294 nucleotidyltransferase-like domain-containing protein [Pseudomonadota bacterium]
MSSPTLLAEVRANLVQYAPFSQLESADLDYLASRLELAYFHHGEIILAPGPDVPPACFIVRQGIVEALQPDPGEEPTLAELVAGESFPVAELAAERPVETSFRAAGDVFCWRLARADFDELARRSSVWREFITRRLGALLDLSRERLQASYALKTAQRRDMNTSLELVMKRDPITARADEGLRTVFERMERARIGSVLVAPADPEAGEDPVQGIFTHLDVIGRVVLPGLPLDTPIGRVMTHPVISLDAVDTVADAVLAMARHSIRHLPVLRDGVLVGIVTERDLFALQRRSMRRIGDTIETAASVEVLASAADDIREWSASLVAQGVNAPLVTGLISRLNDRLAQRLIRITAGEHGIDPGRFCWLALGSEGREEQTIATDQDNGLILRDGDEPMRDAMLAFALQVNQGLDRCGYPLCKGGIMASNPRWCLTLSEWKACFTHWIEHGTPEDLLAACIFFDFRGISGDLGLATRLRDFVAGRAMVNRRFLKQMSDEALRNRSPGSWGGDLIESLLGTSPGGGIDLKLHGTTPFVDAARVLALAGGVRLTGTIERLEALIAAGRLDAREARDWIDAFHFLQSLRLRIQQRIDLRGSENPNQLDIRRLSRLDRRILRESLRQSRSLQQRLRLDYPG